MDSDSTQAIEKQLEDYKQQELVAIANVHRIQGARIALEQLLNGHLSPELAEESITEESITDGNNYS
tara:strand:- start:1259 stop:1459 length:201 start_codon:yes stop_codon:yes gene_type:complete